MTSFLALRPRRALERLHRRHAGDVYRYALAVLGDPREAAEVTRASFQRAAEELDNGVRPGPRRAWLVGLAHDECRLLADCLPTAEELLKEALRLPSPTACGTAELALSRRLDGPLPAEEARNLAAHLAGCEGCGAFERRLGRQRAAIGVLRGVKPPPAALA